jgi:hypothetical protein
MRAPRTSRADWEFGPHPAFGHPLPRERVKEGHPTSNRHHALNQKKTALVESRVYPRFAFIAAIPAPHVCW